jgi:peroxiredoxin
MAGLLALIMSSTSSVAQEAKSVRADLKAPASRTPAPGFALQDAPGKILRLSEYRGRVVLLDFWATSCGGCVQEIPMFIEVTKAYKRRGLEAIGVSEDIAYADLKDADEAWRRVTPFVRERKIPYPIVMGDSRVTADYDIKALPLTYLIDKKGRVAATYLGVVERANLESNIKALVAETR